MSARSAAIAMAWAVATTPVSAHHSPSIYDLQGRLQLEGRVARVQWANPHVFVYIEAESANGEPVTWQIEADAPSNMERHGWYRDSLVAGERVRMQAFPGRDPASHIAKLFAFLKPDGTRLSYVDPAFLDLDAPFAGEAGGLAGVWAPDPLPQDSPVAQLQEGLILASFGLEADVPVTGRGLEAMRSFSDEVSPTVDCVPRTAPSITMFSSGLHSIELREDVVLLRENWFGTERIVHLDADTHDGAPYSIQGHSIGRWDGDTLVVDSEHFAEHREGLFNKLPSSRAKRLIERFRLNPDRRSLTYSWELTDPEYLTQTVTGENRWTYRPDLAFSTVECSLDSAQRFLDD